jgi:hypothetical protein
MPRPDTDWQFYASCRRCGAPVGTPCLDRRMGGPLASVTRPHLARPKRDLADCDECGALYVPITVIEDPGGGTSFLICDECVENYEPYLLHNHTTREVRPEGECPRCDLHHAKVRQHAVKLVQRKRAEGWTEVDGRWLPPNGRSEP